MATDSPLRKRARPNLDRVRSAEDYRSFLRAYLEARALRLSDLARAAGFGRGFPGDVLSGKRRLTPKSFQAFERSLRLPPTGQRLFRLLVAREERDVLPQLDRRKIDAEIEALRRKSWEPVRREVLEAETSALSQAFQDSRILLVYAASGRPDRGASLAEIRSRTRLSDADIRFAIRQLAREGLLRLDRDAKRYVAQDLHLFVDTGEPLLRLSPVFRKACETAAKRVDAATDSDREMFFTSVLCVREDRLPALKDALKRTILRFVDESIDPEGERLAHLLLSLHL